MSARTAELLGFIALTCAFGTLLATDADPMAAMLAAAVILVAVLISAGSSPKSCGRTQSGTVGRQSES